jgi:peptide/nickel transport system permease protein
VFGIVSYATPVFFLGLMAQLVFGVWLGWLPISGQASPTTQAFLQTHTNILFIDADLGRGLVRAVGRDAGT